MVKEVGKKIIAQNKTARHNYFIEDVYEAGRSEEHTSELQ